MISSLVLAQLIFSGVLCALASVLLRSFRQQSFWQRRMAIEETVHSFWLAYRKNLLGIEAFRHGIEPSEPSAIEQFGLLMAAWRHAVWVIYNAMLGVHKFQAFNAAGEADKFVNFADAELHNLIEVAAKVIKSESLSPYVFTGFVASDVALRERIVRYRDVSSFHDALNSKSSDLIQKLGVTNA